MVCEGVLFGEVRGVLVSCMYGCWVVSVSRVWRCVRVLGGVGITRVEVCELGGVSITRVEVCVLGGVSIMRVVCGMWGVGCNGTANVWRCLVQCVHMTCSV